MITRKEIQQRITEKLDVDGFPMYSIERAKLFDALYNDSIAYYMETEELEPVEE